MFFNKYNFYYVNNVGGNGLEIYNSNKGIFINHNDNERPYYFDGTNLYSLLNSKYNLKVFTDKITIFSSLMINNPSTYVLPSSMASGKKLVMFDISGGTSNAGSSQIFIENTSTGKITVDSSGNSGAYYSGGSVLMFFDEGETSFTISTNHINNAATVSCIIKYYIVL